MSQIILLQIVNKLRSLTVILQVLIVIMLLFNFFTEHDYFAIHLFSPIILQLLLSYFELIQVKVRLLCSVIGLYTLCSETDRI